MDLRKHFELSAVPFQIDSASYSLYQIDSQSTMIEQLTHCLNTRQGMIKVVGQAGAGKTVIVRRLNASLNKAMFLPLILDGACRSKEVLLASLLQALGLGSSLGSFDSDDELIRLIHEHCVQRYKQGLRLVLLLDNAHLLEDGGLELLRSLSNMMLAGVHLFSVVFLRDRLLVSA